MSIVELKLNTNTILHLEVSPGGYVYIVHKDAHTGKEIKALYKDWEEVIALPNEEEERVEIWLEKLEDLLKQFPLSVES